jgi:RNA polymerase sigma-70 factor (ECF subfamily)
MRAPDPVLVLRAQAGEAEALDELLRLTQGPLHRYIRRLLGDDAAAEDVLQETLLRIARKLQWLGEPSVYRAWAYRVASREAGRHRGRRRPMQPLEEAEDMAAAGEPEPIGDAEREVLRGAIDKLSARSRAVVALRYWDDLPLAEIADVLEIPLGTVKSRLGYGLRQLRLKLKEER